MDINNIILTDAGLDAFDNGAWVGDIPEGGDIRLKVSALSSPDVQKALNVEHEALRSKNGGKEITTEQATEALNKVLAKVALKDWEGFTSNGEAVAFDREKAISWATDRKGQKFANLIFRAAKMVADNANAFVETAEKNSSTA